MKILVVHTKYQHAGGEDTVVEQEVKLLEASYTVETIFFQNRSGIKGALQFLISIWNPFAAFILRRKIRTFQPDVIHVHNWHFAAGPILFRVANKMNIRVVHTLHNYRLLCPSALLLHNNKIFKDSLYQDFPWSAIRKKVYRNSFLQTFWLGFIVWFHKKIGTWKKVNRYIALTPFTQDLFQLSNIGIDPKKIEVKPNFTFPSRKIHTKTREKHFLFVGRLSEEKGIRMLIDGFEKSNYHLKIIGNGPLREFVLLKSKKNSNIHFLDQKTPDEVRIELQNCEALIFCSLCYETFGMAIIEAYSVGCNVIACNIGAPSSIVHEGENGLLFEAGNSEALLATIEKWTILDENEKIIMRKKALENFSTKYSAEKQMNYFKEIYQGILHQ